MEDDAKLFEIAEKNFTRAKPERATEKPLRTCHCGSGDCDCEVEDEPALSRAGKFGYWAGDKTADW
jgi:hypothetical protein